MQKIVTEYSRPYVADPYMIEDPATAEKSWREYQERQKKIFEELGPIGEAISQQSVFHPKYDGFFGVIKWMLGF